jgi:hypothetical protein
MTRKQTFIELIDKVIDALPGQDQTNLASLKAAAIFGAVEAVRRMSESSESATELCDELRTLEQPKPNSTIHLVKPQN